ncbi:uroporphyrinogen-III synthase [Oerskovia turbata]
MAGRLRDPQRGRELPRRPRPETGAPGSVADGAAADGGRDAAADGTDSVQPPATAEGADEASGVADAAADGFAPIPTPATPPSGSAIGHARPTERSGTSPGAPAEATPEVTRSAGVSAVVGPLGGRTVLLPRSPDRAAALAERLRAEGATVLVSPAIERAPIEDTTAMDAAVADLADGAFAWVVVTSVNAIDELCASAARRGLSLAELSERASTGGHAGSDSQGEPSGVSERARAMGHAGSDNPGAGTRWAVVGPATRRALEAVGVRVDLEAAVNSARGLLAAFDALATSPEADAAGAETAEDVRTSAAARVLVPQGDLAKPTMSEGLRERGWDTRVVTAYRTVAHELAPEIGEAWRAGVIDVVVLTSGSVAREVASQLGAHAGVAGVAIGEPTAQAAQEVWLRVDAVAEQATDDALAAAVLHVAAELSETPARRGNLSEPASTLAHARSDTPGAPANVSEPASTPGHARSDNPENPEHPANPTTETRSLP